MINLAQRTRPNNLSTHTLVFVTQIVESEVDNRRGRGGSAFCQTNQTDDFASGYKTAFVSEPCSCSNATTDAVCIHDAVMTINDLMDFIRRFYNVPPRVIYFWSCG